MPLFSCLSITTFNGAWCTPQYLFFGHEKVCILLFCYSLFILGPFDTSGGPKSPRFRASHPHQPHKPSNEAAPVPLPMTTMTMPPPSTATTMTTNTHCGTKYSRNPLPTNPSPLAAISVSIAPMYEVRGPSRSRIYRRIQYQYPSATAGPERASNNHNDDGQ